MTTERDKELSLVQHLREFRDRLMVASIAVVVAAVVAFIFSVDIIKILLVPVNCSFMHIDTSHFPFIVPAYECEVTRQKLIALSPTENFTTFMRVALFSGVALAMPVILYEIYAYIDPALFPNERRFIRWSGLPIIGLFILGMAFCYFILLPNAIKFLISFGSDVIENQRGAGRHLHARARRSGPAVVAHEAAWPRLHLGVLDRRGHHPDGGPFQSDLGGPSDVSALGARPIPRAVRPNSASRFLSSASAPRSVGT